MPVDHGQLYKDLRPFLIEPSTVKQDGTIWSYCPAHNDGAKHPRHGNDLAGRSLKLHPTIGLKCFADCSWDDLMKQFRQRGYHWSPDEHEPKPPPERINGASLVTIYDYRDEDSNLIAQKGRFERRGADGTVSKTFLWRAAGEPAWTGAGIPLHHVPLFGTETLAGSGPDDWIYVVEGEKAALACRGAGLCTLSPGIGATRSPNLALALEVLRGRRVKLWPDNDEIGREFMNAIRGLLSTVAREVDWIEVPLPPKGDAADFFGTMGCTVRDLEEKAIAQTPNLVYTSPRVCEVRYPIGTKILNFTFKDLVGGTERGKATVDTTMIVHLGKPFRTRVNLLSPSTRRELARELKEVYGPEYGWTATLIDVFNLVADSFTLRDTIIDIIEVQPMERQEFAVEMFMPASQSSMLYGLGAAQKTYLMLNMFFKAGLGGKFVGLETAEGPTLWIDYETANDRGNLVRYRLGRIARGLEMDIPYGRFFYQAADIPLDGMYDMIDNRIRKEGIQYVGVDSALKAVGGAVRDEMAVAGYFSMIESLGCHSMTLGHVTKDDNPDSPFGSTFWRNAPHGRSWYIFKSALSTHEKPVVGIVNKKSSDGQDPDPFAVEITFNDPDGAVMFKRINPNLLPDLEKRSQSVVSAIKAVLQSGSKTTEEVAELIGLEPKEAKYAMMNNPQTFVDLSLGKKGARWGLKARG